MDATGEYHSDRDYSGSEDQKLCVLPHIQTLELGQIQQCCRTWVTWKGESTYGRYGDRWETQNMKAFDAPTPEELIQKT
jgi:hypothetical protein